MSPAPWNRVDANEQVFLCTLDRFKTCTQRAPIKTSLQRFVDDAGRSSQVIPSGDTQPRARPT
ncbi:MAG TPA: hypothetical protein VGI86_08375 [Acidimicrobiia bacterium]|jgi:hypothetical protein